MSTKVHVLGSVSRSCKILLLRVVVLLLFSASYSGNYRGTAPGTEKLLTTVGQDNKYLDTTVRSGVTYFYQVTAVNSVGESPRSNEDSAQTE